MQQHHYLNLKRKLKYVVVFIFGSAYLVFKKYNLRVDEGVPGGGFLFFASFLLPVIAWNVIYGCTCRFVGSKLCICRIKRTVCCLVTEFGLAFAEISVLLLLPYRAVLFLFVCFFFRVLFFVPLFRIHSRSGFVLRGNWFVTCLPSNMNYYYPYIMVFLLKYLFF